MFENNKAIGISDAKRIKYWYPNFDEDAYVNLIQSLVTHGVDQRFRKIWPLESVDNLSFDPSLDAPSWNFETNDQSKILNGLEDLKPWRKGPFQINESYIDSEWCSNIKWNRIKSFASMLCRNKRILDVGASNGYFMFKALEYEPRWMIGVDSSALPFYQFQYLNHFLNSSKLAFLRTRFEDLDESLMPFDTIFALGILYHSRSPLTLLDRLKQRLNRKGHLVLETLVIDGDDYSAICPDRYASMKNVYFMPTLNALKRWCQQVGFKSIELISDEYTGLDEQRVTQWSGPFSLKDTLDPNDQRKTIEGYSAPRRCILVLKPS